MLEGKTKKISKLFQNSWMVLLSNFYIVFRLDTYVEYHCLIHLIATQSYRKLGKYLYYKTGRIKVCFFCVCGFSIVVCHAMNAIFLGILLRATNQSVLYYTELTIFGMFGNSVFQFSWIEFVLVFTTGACFKLWIGAKKLISRFIFRFNKFDNWNK